MKKQTRDYLKSIDLTQRAYLNRVEYTTARMETVSGEPLEELVIEDLIDQEGVRQYLHVVGFTASFVVSVAGFLTENSISVYPLERNVRIIRVDTTDYEFEKPSVNSRILVEFGLGPDDEWNLQGVRENCDVIWNIVLTRLRQHLTGRTLAAKVLVPQSLEPGSD